MERNLKYKILRIAGIFKIFVFFGLCLIHAQIFAQNETANQIFKNINDEFSAKTSAKDSQMGEFFLVLIASAVLIFVIWIAYQFYTQRKQNSSPDSAWGLFKKLCRAHNLSMKERSFIRKICHWNELDDPLPLFVEPNYFKQILADSTKAHFHAAAQGLLEKLFSSGQDLSQELADVNQEFNRGDVDNSHDNRQVNHMNSEIVSNVEKQASNVADDFPSAPFEQFTVSSGLDKPMPPTTRVLLNPIPGRMAFSSLADPIHQLTTEIASASIRHSLYAGREMNERTYNSIGELRQVASEPKPPLFPKSNVPSPNEMLATESRIAAKSSPVSPTPQYLETHKETFSVVPGRLQSHPRRDNQKFIPPKSGEVVSFENITMMETIVMGK